MGKLNTMASSAVARETFLALRREIARIEGRLADRLEALSNDRAVLRAQGARARALFSERFDARKVSADIEDYLLALTQGFSK